MYLSVPVEQSIEPINFTEISPFVSRCEIKVCYIGENRNKTFISKELAEKMGKKLPGCPIVGAYNKETKDFEQHNRELSLENGEFTLIDATRPYGFVDLNAKVWFQDFIDDNKNTRTYLLTEGYLWTGVYPETERVLTNGNNQSMELGKNLSGHWAKDSNGKNQFFILSDSLIQKLCILGEDFEPCFEGAQVKSHFSLDEDFKQKMFAMIKDIKEILNEGGPSMGTPENLNKQLEEQNDTSMEVYKKEDSKESEKEEKKSEEKKDNSNKEDSIKKEKSSEDDSKKDDEEKKKEKKEYSLSEIPEYVELLDKYNSLEKYSKGLEKELVPLRTFKSEKERADKEAMIAKFCMLSDEDKKDVVENINKYSLDDIESKLSVICFRKKINFSLEEEDKSEDKETAVTYTLDSSISDEDNSLPEWVRAVRETASKMN